MTESVPLDKTEQTLQRIADLQTALQSRAPGYENLLRVIHTNLISDPETVAIMSPEQIGIVVAALAMKKGVVLAKEIKAAGARLPNGRRLKDVSLDDLV